MGVQVTTRNNTRNQLTADFQIKRFCIFGNEFIPAVFKNNTGADYMLKGGIPVVRNTAIADQVLPASYVVNEDTSITTNLADVIGFTISEGEVTLANNGTSPISLVKSGTIDGNFITLPDGVTWNTVIGNKALKDVFNGLGFTIDQSTVDNTKFDN